MYETSLSTQRTTPAGVRRRTFRFASWNIKHGRADLSLLREHQPDVAALQEVRREAYEVIRPHFAGGCFSLDLWEGLGRTSEHKPNRHGTAILWSDTFTQRRERLLDHLVAPWKLMLVDLAFTRNLGYFTAASYHALNGRCGPDGFDKPRLSLQVADWLEHQPGAVLLGMDANSPELDHPDHERIRWCFEWLGPADFEGRLLGASTRHRLRDVLRTHLSTHPEKLEAIRAQRPEGPLAISHCLPGGEAKRYDHVLASHPDFEVLDVQYLYDRALEHGSDHALVIADLQVQVGWGPRSEVDMLLPTRLLGGDLPAA